MSTRKRVRRNPSNASSSAHHSTAPPNAQKSNPTNGRTDGKVDLPFLPPPRPKGNVLKDGVSPPLANTSTKRFFQKLALVVLLVGAYYTWRILRFKTEVGGWWNLSTGQTPPQSFYQLRGFSGWLASRVGWVSQDASGKSSSRKEDHTVEDRLNALAEALGMPPHDVVSAMASAVREHVPPASLSSIAARETGPAMKILVGAQQASRDKSRGEDIHIVEKMVGVDEPPEIV